MNFEGSFSRVLSARAGGVIIYSFVLKCTKWFGSETIDVGLFPSDGAQPWFFRNLEFKAGQSYRFDYDTVDWHWYQGDFAAILGKSDKIIQKWPLALRDYRPGECPECHGTHKCRACNGQGFIYPPGKPWEFKSCNKCGGTGICQTCDVPKRKLRYGGGPMGLHPF